MKLFYLFGNDVKYFILIFLAIAIPWCWVYGINGWGDLQVPNGYAGDGVGTYSFIKAFAAGEISPGLFKFVGTLNAPFTANWNDYPFEDFIYFPAGLMAYVFGLSAGTWLYLLCIQLLAGFSFYFAARVLNAEKAIAAVCAVLFALSTFSFYRSIPHLTVAMYWHVPLLLVSLLWCMDPSKVKLAPRQGMWIGVAAGLLAGLYNPYYLVMFLFLLAIVFTGTVYRKEWQHVFRVGTIVASTVAGFLVLHVGTLLFWLIYGKGDAFGRDLWGLVIYGLRLPDLITPVGSRFDAWSSIFNTYLSMYPGYLKGEAQFAYVGLIALSGLGMLSIMGTVRMAARAFERINNLYWIALGIFSFAVVGGINYLLGSFGFVLLRSTNRYSIMLMAIGLLVVSQIISSIKRKWLAAFLAPAILFVGLYDQLPAPISPVTKNANRALVSEDKAIATALERNLGLGAMVFQLPVKAFPETGSINGMGDYDLFRPWLWTKNIRFSYGTMKGRGDADWQAQLTKRPADQMLDELNQYGFSALLINRSAYKDKADELKSKFMQLGYEIFIEQPTYYGFKLKPIARPELPHIDQYIATYGKGFYGQEWDGPNPFRWSDSDAIIRITPNWVGTSKTNSVESDKFFVSFGVQSIGDRSVWLEVGSSKALVFGPGDTTRLVKLQIEADSLPAKLHIYSDRPGVLPGNGDSRKLAFQVRNLRIDVVQ